MPNEPDLKVPAKSILKTSNSNRGGHVTLPALAPRPKQPATTESGKYYFQPFAINSLSTATPRTQIVYEYTEQGRPVATFRDNTSGRDPQAVLAALEHYTRLKTNLLASQEINPYEFSTTYKSDYVQMVPID